VAIINHSEKNIFFKSLTQSIANKCGNKEAPIATFVANAFLPLDTAALKQAKEYVTANDIEPMI
jgi:hypothetical protein